MAKQTPQSKARAHARRGGKMHQDRGHGICPYCEERYVQYPTLGTCHTCYMWFRNWTKRGAAAILKRAKQIETLDKRMRALLGRLPGQNEPSNAVQFGKWKR